MKIFFYTLIIFLFPGFLIFPQEKEYELNEIIVTAGRVPSSFSNLNRNVVVITSEEISETPVNSVQDLLQYVSGVDLKSRGINGVQSDVTIRGGNFEQTLILIDGVKVSDPQTGHHNLNLPISLDDVQRIEILKGQGSRIFGPNAFSGVINIITKKGSQKSLSLTASGGENNFYDGAIHAAYPIGILSNNISFSKKKSDGYIHNTNFDIINFSYNANLQTDPGKINLFFGLNDKKFGANGFYSPIYPNQWEHTTTKLLNLSADLGNNVLTFSPKIYWRRNDDDYQLDYERPAFYENFHQTNVYGAEIQASYKSNLGTTSLGGEFIQEKIESTNLGNHSRDKKGIFVEQKFSPFQDFNIVVGGFAYDYASVGWKVWPGISVGYNISNKIRIYGSAGKAFRIPSYTELFYKSPTVNGNPDLKYEETTNYELGFRFNENIFSSEINLFRKEGKNLIDYVRISEDSAWRARNIAKVNTNGFEINLSLHPALYKNFPIKKISFTYTYLNSDKKTDQFESQYLLDYLRNQLVFSVENNWWFDILQNWIFRYEDRINFEDHFIFDSQISKSFNNFKIFVKATNILNQSYMQISGVPLPGRWISAGIKFTLQKL